MINQKTFEYNSFKYLMVALQLEDKVVIRVSREGGFLYDCDITNDAYNCGKALGKDLVEATFEMIEADIKQKL